MFSQVQSPLFSLPAELREAIYKLSLTADRPITDPASNLLVSEETQDIPPTGITLLRTCWRIHDELDLASFYASNTFRFTRPVIASWFFSHTPARFHSLIREVDIDLSVIDHTGNSNTGFDAGDGRQIAPEWAHYLCCGPERHDVALICIYQPEMYFTDMARVKRLTLDIVGLQDQADRISERFSISALNDMLSSLVRSLQITACSELAKIDLESLCIRGRDLDGAVTDAIHAIGTCRPAKLGSEAYRGEIVLLKHWVDNIVHDETRRLIPSTDRYFHFGKNSVRHREGFGTLHLAHDGSRILWTPNEDPTTTPTTVVTTMRAKTKVLPIGQYARLRTRNVSAVHVQYSDTVDDGLMLFTFEGPSGRADLESFIDALRKAAEDPYSRCGYFKIADTYGGHDRIYNAPKRNGAAG